MFTAITSFALPAPFTDEQARAAFEASAPAYANIPGLVRKYYLLGADRKSAGGVYLWRDLARAQAFFDEAWAQRIAERYGSFPTVSYFSSPVLVEGQG